MPPFELDENSSKYQIRAYKPGLIQINEKIFTHSVIITADEVIENWAPQTIEELTTATLTPVMELKPDILLIGTGSKQVFIAATIYGELINNGIGVEIMNTSAACRTFNALTAENRRVVAALIIR